MDEVHEQIRHIVEQVGTDSLKLLTPQFCGFSECNTFFLVSMSW